MSRAHTGGGDPFEISDVTIVVVREKALGVMIEGHNDGPSTTCECGHGQHQHADGGKGACDNGVHSQQPCHGLSGRGECLSFTPRIELEWIPRSTLHEDNRLEGQGETGELIVKTWKAKTMGFA